METSKELLDQAVKVFTANPFWREAYETAPSDNCRQRIALNFAYSIRKIGPETFCADRDEIEKKLDLNDWKHLCAHTPPNPWKGHCLKMIRSLGGNLQPGDLK